MKKRVIKLTELDIERLISRIIKEEHINEIGFERYKRSDLKPAVATIKGEKYLVIIDKESKVVAKGPNLKGLQGASQERICQISEVLINDLFELEEGKMNEIDTGDATEIKPINFCPRK